MYKSSDFDRNFKIMKRVVIGFMIFVAVLMIGMFIFYGVIGAWFISDPNGAAKEAGGVVKSFLDGVNGQ